MTIGGEAVWDWLKKAPLPVVLAISLSSTVFLAGWLYAVDDKASEAAKDAAVAASAKVAEARRVEKMDEKIDTLLKIVLEIQAEKAAEKKAADEKAAATKKKGDN